MSQAENQNTDIFWKHFEKLDNQHWLANSFNGEGHVNFKGHLRFSGKWKGTLSSRDKNSALSIYAGSRVTGTILVNTLTVAGELIDVDIQVDNLRVLKGALIRGQIRAKNIILEEGAVVEANFNSAIKNPSPALQAKAPTV